LKEVFCRKKFGDLKTRKIVLLRGEFILGGGILGRTLPMLPPACCALWTLFIFVEDFLMLEVTVAAATESLFTDSLFPRRRILFSQLLLLFLDSPFSLSTFCSFVASPLFLGFHCGLLVTLFSLSLKICLSEPF
jgi:hypothetical protein